ncbi:rhomboid protease [Plasmodiophora brassicae]
MKGGEARHRNGSPVSPGGDHRLQERRQVVARSSPVGVKPRLFVSLMIVTDVALCVYSMYLNGWQFESFSTNPLLGPSSSVLDGMGAKDTGRIRAGEWWRLVTAMCLHSGVLHLAVNMSMLWRLGGSLEQGFGFGRVAIVYVLAGISGDILSALFLPMQISVGASGALFGLLGALYGDLAHNYRLMEGSSFWYLVSLVLNTALGLAAGLLPLVDNFAHVGGFVCGLLVGSCVLVDPHHARRSRSMPWYSAPLRIVSATLAVLWFIMLIWVFAWDVDPNRICGWCRALGCLPTPYWSCCVPHVDPATGRTVPC